MSSKKPRIWSYIDEDSFIRLKALAARPEHTESEIVSKALRAFFSHEHDDKRDGAIIRRLDQLTRQNEVLKRNQIISSEAFALFMRYFLTVTPPLSDNEKAAAQAQGLSRFETYLESLRTILADGDKVLFTAMEDVIVDESAFFTKEELMRLHEPAPTREVAHA